jgi:hypothetical protein
MGRANASRSVARETRFCHILERDLVELQAIWTISYIKSMIYGEASYLINVVTLLSMPKKIGGISSVWISAFDPSGRRCAGREPFALKRI